MSDAPPFQYLPVVYHSLCHEVLVHGQLAPNDTLDSTKTVTFFDQATALCGPASDALSSITEWLRSSLEPTPSPSNVLHIATDLWQTTVDTPTTDSDRAVIDDASPLQYLAEVAAAQALNSILPNIEAISVHAAPLSAVNKHFAQAFAFTGAATNPVSGSNKNLVSSLASLVGQSLCQLLSFCGR